MLKINIQFDQLWLRMIRCAGAWWRRDTRLADSEIAGWTGKPPLRDAGWPDNDTRMGRQ